MVDVVGVAEQVTPDDGCADPPASNEAGKDRQEHDCFPRIDAHIPNSPNK